MSEPALPPKKQRIVPTVSIDSTDAQAKIAKIVKNIMSFSNDTENTVGTGARIQVLQSIGAGIDSIEEWVDVDHSNRVTARWVFAREIQKRRPKAVNLCDIESPKSSRFVGVPGDLR